MPVILVYQTPESESDFFSNCLPFGNTTNSYTKIEKEQILRNLIDGISLKNKEEIQSNIKQKTVDLVAYTSEKPIFAGEVLIDEENNNFEGFSVTEENKGDVLRIFERMVEILRDPESVFKNLKNLDEALGEQIRQRGLDMTDNSPQYLIAGFGHYILGPWQEGYQPLKKGSILNKELLKREQEAGINSNGLALFVGSIDPDSANQFVKDGHYFSEDEQVSKFLLHGKYSHRLFFEIIREAELSGDLNLEVSGNKLTQKQLLQMLVSCKLTSSYDQETTIAWDAIFDRIEDSTCKVMDNMEENISPHLADEKFKKNSLNPDYYCFSSKSPAVLKSLITCFGREKLPNICQYMTDSHYKQMAKMIYKLKDSGRKSFKDIPDDIVYLKVTQSMFTDTQPSPNNIISEFPFTSSIEDKKCKTIPFDEEKYDRNIRKKPETLVDPSSIEQVKTKYNSFPDYSISRIY